MLKLNKTSGKKGIKLLATLLTAVIMITGCGGGSGAPVKGTGYPLKIVIRLTRKSQLGSWIKRKRLPT